MIDTAVFVVTIGSLMAAFVNAAFGTGGVYILLLSAISVLPISVAVPLQAAFAAASLISRVGFFWQSIRWNIVGSFIFGGVFGVMLGARTFSSIPEDLLALLLGIVLLILIWCPVPTRSVRIRYPFIWVGALHSYLGTLLGVGGLLQPILLRLKLRKFEITGTAAACMLALDVVKAIGYTSVGFSYLEYTPHIIGATLAGVIGTWAGKRIAHRISEQMFHKTFKVFVSIVAFRLIVTAWF